MIASTNPHRLIRFDEVTHLTGVSRPRIYQLISEGRFPKQLKLGALSVAFVESEVRDWIAERIAARDGATK